MSVREELNDVLRQDVNRYIVDEMLSEAPRGNATSSDVIRLFSECAVALNLPPNFVSCGASESDQRGLLGRAFGPCSIAHLLKCLEGIFDE